MKFRWKRSDGQAGSYIFIPVVTVEDEDFSPESRRGLIVGLGWNPEIYDEISHRGIVQFGDEYKEYVGYVTNNPDLQSSYSKKGNIYDQQRFDFRKSFLTRWLSSSRNGSCNWFLKPGGSQDSYY